MLHRVIMILCLSLASTLLCAKSIIVFDAGSTGTRMYVYDVQGDRITTLHSTKIKPGLSELTPNLYSHYFRLLLDSAKDILDDRTKAQTPIYLYATAGVRMLPAADQTAIFDGTAAGPGVRDVLTELAVSFGYPAPSSNQIRVISGTEEGLFIWIANNHSVGTFNHSPLTPENTFAALEMGGASTELAFLSPEAKHHILPWQHQGIDYRIYSRGYDGLGADKALEHMKRHHNPKHQGFAACFPVGASFSLGENKPTLTGTGHFATCVKTIKAAFFDPADYRRCQTQYGVNQCSRFASYQPPLKSVSHYILTDGFYYLFDYLKLSDETTQAQFTTAAKAFCSTPWSELQAQDPNNPYLIKFCFNAALTKTLLEGLHIKKNAILHAAQTIDSQTLTWTQGAALQLGQ